MYISGKVSFCSLLRRRSMHTLLGILLAAANVSAAAPVQRTFDSAEAGAQALAQAVKARDENALRAIFGQEGSKLLGSGDAVADAQSREKFDKAYDEANKLVPDGDAKAMLVIGKDEWPMPIPLVRQGDRWRFDTQAGADEILKRRIGRNELAAMQVCLTIVDAEREFAARHLDANGIPVYATRFASTQGKHDGLYWPTTGSETPSPLGSLLAKAADEGYKEAGAKQLQPYHGYYYRILTRQGKDAPGGRRDYLLRGKMIGGFAVFAYPARHGASGIMSFLVSDDGQIYAKDLGMRTKSAGAAFAAFNPDQSWKREEIPQNK